MAKKKILPLYPIAVLLVIGVGGYLGCDPSWIPGSKQNGSTAGTNVNNAIPDRTSSTILIGSFNLQRLGPSKLSQPLVMQRFAQIIRRYDVIALQEITSQDQRTLPTLVAEVNKDGSRYSYTISPRIGRAASGYYEQYAFVYDTQRVQSGQEFSYVVQDERDMMHREPFVGRFHTLISGQQPFGFTLINVHTDPDEIKQELDVLADVYLNVRQFEYQYREDDVLLLGDLNQEPGKLQQLEAIPAFESVIADLPTNTRRSKTLDNILVDRQNTVEFTGRAGTLDLARAFEISDDEALEISDHLPVWAEFSIAEQSATTTVASAVGPIVR